MGRSVWLPPAVAVFVIVLSGCGGAGGEPHFQTANGWHVLVEPGQTASAANVPFAAEDRSQSFPSRTIASLPRRGILIWIQWIRWRDTSAAARLYPRRSLPLQVSQATGSGAPSAVPEGTRCPSAAPDCTWGRLSAQESGWDTTVWIFVGSAERRPGQIAAANSELARLRFD